MKLTAEYDVALNTVFNIITSIVEGISQHESCPPHTILHLLEFVSLQFRAKIGISCFAITSANEEEDTIDKDSDGGLYLAINILKKFLVELQRREGAIYRFLK